MPGAVFASDAQILPVANAIVDVNNKRSVHYHCTITATTTTLHIASSPPLCPRTWRLHQANAASASPSSIIAQLDRLATIFQARAHCVRFATELRLQVLGKESTFNPTHFDEVRARRGSPVTSRMCCCRGRVLH